MELSTTKKMAKNFSWLAIGGVVGGILNFVAVVYLARALGADNFGWTQFAIAILAYLILFVDSGLSLFGTREISRSKTTAGAITLNIYALRLCLGSVIFVMSALIIFFFPITVILKMLLLGTFIFLFSRVFSTEWVFQGLERMEYIAFYKIFFASLYLMTLVFFVKTAAGMLTAAFLRSFWGLTASLLFIFLLYKSILRLDLKEIDPGVWQQYFWQSIPLGASIIMIQIYNNMDTIMLGLMDKPAVVGYYNAAYQIYYAGLGIFVVWMSVAIPVMSRRIKEDQVGAERFISHFAKITLLFMVPLVILTALVAPLIITLLFSQTYAPAIIALRFLIWNLITVAIGSIYGVLILVAAGKFKEFFLAALVGAAVNMALNFLLIPAYSFIGAAVATLIAEASAVIISYHYAVKVVPLHINLYLFRPAIFSLAGAAIFGLVMFWPGPLGLMLRLLIGGVLFALTYTLALLLTEKDFICGFAREIIGAR